MKRGFTLIELLVVITIIVILAAVATPAIRSISKGNSAAEAVNQIRATLSNARAVAISQHRQAGVVFFEETVANAGTAYTSQTAMQIIAEDPSQYGATYTPRPAPDNTIFVANSDRSFLPVGVQVGCLAMNDTTGEETINTSQANTSYRLRAVIFDSDGQLVVRTGVCRPGATNTMYKKSMLDWNLSDPAVSPASTSNTLLAGETTTGSLIVYNATDYAAQNFTNDATRSAWLAQHAEIMAVNAYTGSIIR